MRMTPISLFAFVLAVSGSASARDAEEKEEPAHFVNDVMPLVTKLGCNAVACHGSLKGKAGFKLSMFGAEPESDYQAVAKLADGRRIDKVEPLKSLLLLKATASIPHTGGQKIKPDSPQYVLLASWIAQGAPWGDENSPELVSLEASPEKKALKKGETG